MVKWPKVTQPLSDVDPESKYSITTWLNEDEKERMMKKRKKKRNK